jgi:hypothetical protein
MKSQRESMKPHEKPWKPLENKRKHIQTYVKPKRNICEKTYGKPEENLCKT